MRHNRVLVWFSCGVTSAVAGKLTLKEFPDAEVLYCDTGGEHPDNVRFLKDVAKWYERDITVLKNPKYTDHFDTFRTFIVGPHGAICTRELKRKLRIEYQRSDDLHIFGFDAEESDRVADFHERNPELNFRAPLIEQRLTKANCKWIVEQAGIELPEMYKLGFRNNNCFSGETEFITSRGIRKFSDAEGESVLVLGAGGVWRSAEIQCFGKQSLLRLVVSRGSTKREIYTTAGHRWFVKLNRGHTVAVEKTSVDLQSGDRLVSMFGRLGGRVRPSAFGIAQGIVFGDGTRGNTTNVASILVLCGEKNQELLKYFPLSPVAEISTGLRVGDLPRHWKEISPIDECQSFLYGWLAGYFAADGCVSGGECLLSSANLAHLRFARDVAARLGIGTNAIRSVLRKGLGETETLLHTLPLIASTLREDFFLLSHHREMFNSTERREPHPWFVESVESSDRVEDVFCAVVPDGAAFTLADNIFTGNCIGCVKGGAGYWNKIRVLFPDHFARMAAIERKVGHTILRNRKTGEPIPLDVLPTDYGRDEKSDPPDCDPFFCASTMERTGLCET